MQTINQFKTSLYLPVVVFLTLVLFVVQNVCGQNRSPLWGDLPDGRYAVGYKIFDEKDFSRSVYKKFGEKFALSARELKISVWYPAQNSSVASPGMKFSDYVFAIEGARTSDAARIESRNRFVKSSLAQELSAAAITDLLQAQTAARRGAPSQKGKTFPVIVFGQGLFYESPLTHTILCEFLASQGFVVATTTLTGARSPFVKLDAVDLEADVRDLEFTAARARAFENADEERFAVVGFDMGGLAGLILTMRNPEVDAYASLDSGILAAHNLRLVRAMPDYDPLRLRVPLFQATHPVGELARFNVSEDASFLDAARFSDRLILRFPDTRHADFTSRPMIESIIAKMRDDRTTHRRRSFETVAQNLLVFLKAHLQDDSKSREVLYNLMSEASDLKVKFTKERKPALARPTMTEDEFFNYLYTEGAGKAVEMFRKLRAQFPNEPIFREDALNQIGYNQLYRGEAAEAIRIFMLNTEAFPKSANAYDSLAEAFAAAGDIERAKFNYKQSLEINPNNENAKARLKELEEKK